MSMVINTIIQLPYDTGTISIIIEIVLIVMETLKIMGVYSIVPNIIITIKLWVDFS